MPVKSAPNGPAPAVLIACVLIMIGFAHAFNKPAGEDAGSTRVSLRSPIGKLEGFEAEPLELDIMIRNEGRSSLLPTGKNPCLLSYHLLDADGRLVRFDNPRTTLPGRIAPGREAAVRVRLKAPIEKGPYLLEFDILREGLAWFKDSGSRTLILPLDVKARDWPEDHAPFLLAEAGTTRIESEVA